MLFMVRFILLVFHFLTLIFLWSVEIGMHDQKEWQPTQKSLVFNREGHYIYESHEFNEVLRLEEECYLCPIERDFPLGHEGRIERGTGRKRWIWKAWLEALLSRWLQWCSARRLGVRVFAVLGRSMLVVALAPPVSTWLRAILPRNAFQAPAHSHEGQGHSHHPSSWDTFCWGCVVSRIAQECCRAARIPKELLWALNSAGALE